MGRERSGPAPAALGVMEAEFLAQAAGKRRVFSEMGRLENSETWRGPGVWWGLLQVEGACETFP